MKTKIFTLLFAIAASVATMSAQAFSGNCGTNVEWELTSGVLTIRTVSTGEGTMTSYTSNNESPWSTYASSIESVVIEDGVANIGNRAFRSLDKLTSVSIPASVTRIGVSAFLGAKNLTSIELPQKLARIDDYAFDNCIGLTGITCHAKNPPLLGGENVFNKVNTGLIPLTVPVESMDAYATAVKWGEFAIRPIPDGCLSGSGECGSGLSWALNCNGVLTISGKGEMSDYTYASPAPWGTNVQRVIISHGVTSIGARAFRGCSKLPYVQLPNSVTTLGESAFLGCTKLSVATLSDNLVQIGDSAFMDCTSLLSISMPNSVTSVGEWVFAHCSAMTSVTLSNAITSIKWRTFSGCSALTSLVIPAYVTSIENYAFGYCGGLKSITCEAINPNVFAGVSISNVFSGVPADLSVYVYPSVVESYKKAAGWKNYKVYPISCSITWQDEEGNQLAVENVEYGKTPAYQGSTPEKEGFVFVGWLPTPKKATKDAVYTTYFVPQQSDHATIRIKGENCKMQVVSTLPKGSNVWIEAKADDECYSSFVKWSDGNKDNPRDITVNENTEFTAEFNTVTYTITDKTSNGGKVQVNKK